MTASSSAPDHQTEWERDYQARLQARVVLRQVPEGADKQPQHIVITAMPD
jgi:hypothetical protein